MDHRVVYISSGFGVKLVYRSQSHGMNRSILFQLLFETNITEKVHGYSENRVNYWCSLIVYLFLIVSKKQKQVLNSPNFSALWQKAIKQTTINHLKSIGNCTILVLINFWHINLQSLTSHDSFIGLFLHIFWSFNALNSSFTFCPVFSCCLVPRRKSPRRFPF